MDKLVKACLSTLYNSARVAENRQRLLEVGAFEAVLPYMDSHLPSYQMSALFCIAYLSDEEKSNVFEGKKSLLEKVVHMLTEAMKHGERVNLGWSALEMIQGTCMCNSFNLFLF